MSAGFAVGISQLAAAAIDPQSSPMIAVGQAAINATPEWLKSFAIRTFGTHDKTALLTGMGIVIALVALALGAFATGRRMAGPVGIGAFAVVGVAAALTRPSARPIDSLASVVGGLGGIACFIFLRGRLDPVIATSSPGQPSGATETPSGYDRRRFLVASGYAGVVAVLSGGIGRILATRSAATASRADVRIPSPASPIPSVPPGTDLHVPGLSPFITSNDQFYRVDTALLAPSVTAENWALRIHGMVDKEMTIKYSDLVAMPLIERDITLCCVSNPVGGQYISNARWVGALLKPILDEAGVASGATQIVTRSVDGFTIGTPTAAAMDGRDAMLAVSMNGQPLPIAHGFPVRMIVPGLFGYVSAMKWIVDMELTTFPAFDAYWVQRGWAQQGPVITESRIDTPRDGASVSAGTIPLAGVAWAQHKGIAAVDVQVDEGPFLSAKLSAQDNIDTWRQWVYYWPATAGQHTLRVRATDLTGYTQTSADASSFPSGATGLHTISIQVH